MQSRKSRKSRRDESPARKPDATADRERSRERESSAEVKERAKTTTLAEDVAALIIRKTPEQLLKESEVSAALQKAADKHTALMARETAVKKHSKKKKSRFSPHSTAFLHEQIHKTQRRHAGACIKYQPMRRLVKEALNRGGAEAGRDITQVTKEAVLCAQELAETAVIGILRQSIQRREENGGKKLMEQNLLNAFLAWAEFQQLDFVQEFARTAKDLDWTPQRPGLSPPHFMERADFVRMITERSAE